MAVMSKLWTFVLLNEIFLHLTSTETLQTSKQMSLIDSDANEMRNAIKLSVMSVLSRQIIGALWYIGSIDMEVKMSQCICGSLVVVQ